MAGAYVFVATAPILGQAVYCLFHLAACRLWTGRGPYGPLVGSFFPGLVAVVLVTVLASQQMQAHLLDTAGYLSVNVVAYGALGWGYFHFVNLNIASLRIRMLHELAEAGGSMPRAVLLAEYSNDSMIAARVDRLLGGGHLVCRGQRFYSGKAQFLYAARFFDALRGFILGRQAAARIAAVPAMQPEESKARP